MITHPFTYEAPTTIDDAVKALGRSREAKVIAGGHSLIPLMKLGLAEPDLIVDIGRIAGLREIKSENGAVIVGALATHRSIAENSSIASIFTALAEAAGAVGDLQVRSRGTIGGSLAHADPAADEPAPTVAFDATIRVIGPRGRRDIPAREFFKGTFETALGPNEIVIEIRLAAPAGRAGSAYEKFAHPASGFAIVGVAAVVAMKSDGTIDRAAIGVTGAAASPFRANAAERALVGTRGDAIATAAAAGKAADGVTTLSDLTASSEFRKHLVSVYARRALERAVERAQG
jgi:carbon-monoxide dehydrogenase medium subunit